MPSEDSKFLKKVVASEENVLSSIRDSHKKNPVNGSKSVADSSAKSRPKQAKVKKEDDEDFEKPARGGGSSGSRSKDYKVKKEERLKEDEEEEDSDDKPISKRSSAAVSGKEVKKKKKKEEGKKATPGKDGKEKKEKKVYELPGQKRDPPEERDPLRIFYESLYKQVPHSEMAQIWMMESGLLAMGEAKKVFDMKQKKKLVSPIKSVSAAKRSTKSVTVKTMPSSPVSSNKKKIIETKVALQQSKKRKTEDESSDGSDDFVITKMTKQKVK